MSTDGDPSPSQQPQLIYYCHICSRNLTNLTADYECPICHGGFVELLENQPAPTVQSTAPATGNFGPAGNISLGPNDVNAFVRQVTPFFNYIMAPQQPQTPAASTSQTAQSGTAAPQIQMGTLQGFLQNLLQGLTNNGNVQIQFHINGDGGATGFAIPVPLHGNVADYAWGPGGLDAIVTQLLNQVEGGAPPMQKDKIIDLPEVIISEEQVAKRIQCAICMEDFKFEEKVCRIACEHLYHRDCIVPWLERHNSCPICRKCAETGQPVPRSPDIVQPGFTLFGSGGSSVGESAQQAARQQQTPAQQSTSEAGNQASGSSGGPNRWMDIEDLD